jgi:hypothetical protein
MPHTSLHTHGCRVSDEWTLRGMRAAVLENELLRVLVLLDKGAEIVEFRYKPIDLDPLLRMPGELRNPAHGQPSVASAGGNFLDYYSGGWQEIVPNGGSPVTYKGAEYGLHGEVSLLPWRSEVVEDTTERVALRCAVRPLRTPLLLERTMALERGKTTLFLDERLTNEGGEELDLMWGHHVAFGLPFLEEGATIASSARQMLVHPELDELEARRAQPDQRVAWPTARSSQGGELDLSIIPPRAEATGTEMAYLYDFEGPAWYAITSGERQAGFAMRWDGDLFSYLWLWQELGVSKGFPWWGRTYTVALEPWTGYPTLGLAEAIKAGTQLTVAPGQTITTSLLATAYHGVSAVGGVSENGSVT